MRCSMPSSRKGWTAIPSMADAAGLGHCANAALRGRPRDESAAGIAAAKAQTADQLKRLGSIDAAALSGMDR